MIFVLNIDIRLGRTKNHRYDWNKDLEINWIPKLKDFIAHKIEEIAQEMSRFVTTGTRESHTTNALYHKKLCF